MAHNTVGTYCQKELFMCMTVLRVSTFWAFHLHYLIESKHYLAVIYMFLWKHSTLWYNYDSFSVLMKRITGPIKFLLTKRISFYFLSYITGESIKLCYEQLQSIFPNMNFSTQRVFYFCNALCTLRLLYDNCWQISIIHCT